MPYTSRHTNTVTDEICACSASIGLKRNKMFSHRVTVCDRAKAAAGEWVTELVKKRHTYTHISVEINHKTSRFFFSSFFTVFSMNKVKCLPFFFSLYFSKKHFPLCLFSWIIFLIASIPNTFHRWNFICANLCQLVSSNDVKKKNGTEKETVTFFGKTKTSQQLTHICLGQMCVCVYVFFSLSLYAYPTDEDWVHIYKLHLPRNFNSCSGLIINNCSFFSIFIFDGNAVYLMLNL